MTNRIWQMDGKSDFAIHLPMARTERTYERTNERVQDPGENPQELNDHRPVEHRQMVITGLRELLDEAFETRDWHRIFWIKQMVNGL